MDGDSLQADQKTLTAWLAETCEKVKLLPCNTGRRIKTAVDLEEQRQNRPCYGALRIVPPLIATALLILAAGMISALLLQLRSI